MKIMLINIDSKIPNLALKKIEKYHLDRNDKVIWDLPLWRSQVDKVYVSCIFTKNKKKCGEWNSSEIGGSGYSLTKTLPQEIEDIKPRINLGFTTRGCIRKCAFCIVPEKEGMIRVIGDIYDLWDGKSKELTLLDNNILALPKHFKLICEQIHKERLRVDFNQGLDHRLLTKDIVELLKSISTSDIRFAFDNPQYKSSVEKAIKLLHKYNIQAMWYVLVGFNTTFQEDLDRINYLHSEQQRAYVMRYEDRKNELKYIALARWVNSPYWRNAMSWKDFINRPENKQYIEL